MTTPAHSEITLGSLLSEEARRNPGRLAMAVSLPGRRHAKRYTEISLADLERDAKLYAEAFAHHGITPGMRTAVMITPGREFCAAVFALLKLGAPPVFIDPGIGLRNVGHCMRQAAPEAFVGIRKAQLARRLFGWGRQSIRLSLTVESLERETITLGQPVPETGPRDRSIAAIAFTSGSTGPPKGVVFAHRTLLTQLDLVRLLLGPAASGPHLATFPLFLLFAPLLELAAVLPEMDTSKPATADPARLVAAIRDYQCQSAFASPVLVRKLGAYCRETGVRLDSLHRVFSAGAPSDPDVLANFARAISTDGEVFTPYGATEALPVSNISSREIARETHKTRAGAGVCVGRPLPGVDARIIPISDDPIGDWNQVSTLPAGEIGEIAVSGGVVSPAYFDHPSANQVAKIPYRATDRIYHRMGDIGYFDADGRLWMCGRKSQRVVAGKRTYFTVPVEGVFNGHPEVARTALVGITQRGATVPVLCVELPRRQSSKQRRRIAKELQAMGAAHEHTRPIQHILFHRAFPVDARHNSKIRREQLARWADKRLGKEV